MTYEQEVEFDKHRYVWSYNPEIRSERECWSWSSTVDYMAPPRAQESRLNRILIREHAATIVSEHDHSQHGHLYLVFRSMGALGEDIVNAGLGELFRQSDPEAAREFRFMDLPPATHLPLNSPVLRDWYFSKATENAVLPELIDCRGFGPFETKDFAQFLQMNQVICISVIEEMMIQKGEAESKIEEFVAGLRQKTTTVVLGREGWSESELNQLIDDHVGRSLHIYSQEMFLSFLATKKDPFFGGPDVLAAFKADHAALEFVSVGWPGWVTTYVKEDRSEIPLSDGFTGGVQHGPLHVLGYCVGRSGEKVDVRREILRKAFTGELPIVGPAAYMAEWGTPESAARLHKMADSLATFCRNMKMRQSPSHQAIVDWESDLAWLKDEFYHGHIQFHWPDTAVFAI